VDLATANGVSVGVAAFVASMRITLDPGEDKKEMERA
jgi:hypothetical protein